MSENKFTKGPWMVDLFLSDNEHFVINIPNKDGVAFIERHVSGKDQEDLPNAHLIAAAPEMYEALKQIRILMGQIEGKATTQSFEAASIIAKVLAKASPITNPQEEI